MKLLFSNFLLPFMSVLLMSQIQVSLSIKEWWEESKALELTSTNFRDIVGKDQYVLVKFYTKWCKYCKILAPIYDDVVDHLKTKGMSERVLIARIEANSNQEISMMYGVYSFPTIVLFGTHDVRPKAVYEGERSVKGFWFWLNKNMTPIKRSERYAQKKEQSKKDGQMNIVKTVQQVSGKSLDKDKENKGLKSNEPLRDKNTEETLVDTKEKIVSPHHHGNKTENATETEANNTNSTRKVNKERIEKMHSQLEALELGVSKTEKVLKELKFEILNQKEIKKNYSKKVLLFLLMTVILIVLFVSVKCVSSYGKVKNVHSN